jgi:acyl-CoA dehydrogenase
MRWLGAAIRAHEIATDYACRRQAFGKPLIDHEGVGFMLAENLIDLKAGRTDDRLVRRRARHRIARHGRELDGQGGGVEALMRVADRCVQVMGGTGVRRHDRRAGVPRDPRLPHL